MGGPSAQRPVKGLDWMGVGERACVCATPPLYLLPFRGVTGAVATASSPVMPKSGNSAGSDASGGSGCAIPVPPELQIAGSVGPRRCQMAFTDLYNPLLAIRGEMAFSYDSSRCVDCVSVLSSACCRMSRFRMQPG